MTGGPNEDFTEWFCQQWSPDKGTFVAMTSTRSGIHPRIMLAWVAVETGGLRTAPGHNYLQIKGTGDRGSRGGFAMYSSARKAAKAAAGRIRQEPGIGAAIGKGPMTLMKAIANAWNDGPGVTVGSVPQEYYSALVQKFQCIERDEVKKSGFLGIAIGAKGEDDALLEWDELSDVGEAAQEGAERVRDAAFGWVGDLLEGVWPVLLKGALASTGLALIAYGVVKTTGSSGAGSHTKEAVGTSASVAQGVS